MGHRKKESFNFKSIFVYILKLVNLYSTYYMQAMPFLKHFTILTYNFPAQALSTVSFLCEGEPPPPISTPWGAYRPHKAATRCSEPT